MDNWNWVTIETIDSCDLEKENAVRFVGDVFLLSWHNGSRIWRCSCSGQAISGVNGRTAKEAFLAYVEAAYGRMARINASNIMVANVVISPTFD